MTVITSAANEKVQNLKKLLLDRGYRYERLEYVIEGLRAIETAKDLKELFVREGQRVPDIKSVTVNILSEKIFDKIAQTENSQGLLAVASLKMLDDCSLKKDRNYVYLDTLADPGNMGTIIRTSCAFGIEGIICSRGCVDPYSPKVVRSAAGALSNISIIASKDISELAGFNIVAADAGGADLKSFKWPQNFILAIGNEANGLSQDVRDIASATVSIKMRSCVESLNAAVSCAIILSKAVYF